MEGTYITVKLDLGSVISGVGLLIGAYLLLNNATAFNSIVSSGGDFALSAISTLQGRSRYGI